MRPHEDGHGDERTTGPWGYIPGYLQPGDVVDMPGMPSDDRVSFIDCGPLDGDHTGGRYRDLGTDADEDHGAPVVHHRPAPITGSTGVLARRVAALRLGLPRVGRMARAVITDQRIRIVLRWLARQTVLYPALGAWVLAGRWWEARTNARYERMMRAAEAAGDQDRSSSGNNAPSRPATDGTGGEWICSRPRSRSRKPSPSAPQWSRSHCWRWGSYSPSRTPTCRGCSRHCWQWSMGSPGSRGSSR